MGKFLLGKKGLFCFYLKESMCRTYYSKQAFKSKPSDTPMEPNLNLDYSNKKRSRTKKT